MLKNMFKPRAEKIADMDLTKIVFASHDGKQGGMISPEDLIGFPKDASIQVRNNSSMDALRYALDPKVLNNLLFAKDTCDFCGNVLNEYVLTVSDFNNDHIVKECPEHGTNVIKYTISFNNPYDFERKVVSEGICTGEHVKALKTQNLKPEENDSALLQEEEIERISRERDLWKMASELFFQELRDARVTNSTAGATKRMPPV